MSVFILLTAALLPAIILFFYICKQDPQPEPTGWLVKAALYGVGICFPVSLLELTIENVFGLGEPITIVGTTLQAFFVAALPE